MPVHGPTGNDDPVYKHLSGCKNCYWEGAVVSDNKNPRKEDAEEKHNLQVSPDACKGFEYEHISSEETTWNDPKNFADDTHK